MSAIIIFLTEQLLCAYYARMAEKKIRRCKARGCDAMFTPKVRTQIYHSPACRNREQQRKLRQRARIA